MATGDFKNNVQKLQKELKLIKYTDTINLDSMTQGQPSGFLPIYHYLFTSYSHAIAEMISATDIELYGKTDFKFMEAMYKILRDMFNYKPPITKEQFFSSGFAERKIIMCAEVTQKVREKNKSLQPAKKSTTTTTSTLSQYNSSKNPRPKSAESTHRVVPASMSVPKSKHLSGDKAPSRPATAQQVRSERLTSPRSNTPPELRQKTVPQRHMARTMLESSSVKSPPRVTKQVVTQSEIHRNRPAEQFELMGLATPSISHVRSNAVEVVSVPRGFNIEPDDIETVNAVTRGDSFMEPKILNPTEAQWQSEVNSLYQVMNSLTEKISKCESKMMNVSNTVYSQIPQTDPKVQDLITKIQQQLETLNARMVLVENRVAMVEAKIDAGLSTVPTQVSSHSGGGFPTNESDKYTNGSQSEDSLQDKHRVGILKTKQIPIHAVNSQPANENVDAVMPQRRSEDDASLSQSSPAFEKFSEKLETVQNSLPSYATSQDNNSFGLSPIRQLPNAPTNGMPLLHDTTNDDTFAMATDDDARRSSTPTDFDSIRGGKFGIGNDSMSFIKFGDQSTQEKVDRMKNLIRSTEEMLKPS